MPTGRTVATRRTVAAVATITVATGTLATLAATGFVATVPLMDLEYLTPYTRTGELFNGLVVLLLAGLGLLGPRRLLKGRRP